MTTSLPFDPLVETTCLPGCGGKLNPPTASKLFWVLLGFSPREKKTDITSPIPLPRQRDESGENSFRERCCCLSDASLSLSFALSLAHSHPLGAAQRERRVKGASLRFLGLGDFLALSLDSQLNVDVSTRLSG